MSENQERDTVSRLVGVLPGDRRADEERGQLERGGAPPAAFVVLLDEIEKAHAEVFDVLLQVLDDGRLTDGHGRTVDFRNSVLIMTSNVRSADAMRDVFRPEFLNRIDEIVEFEPLSREQLGRRRRSSSLERLRERLAERRLALELTDEAKQGAGRSRLGSRLRRTAAQAGDPAPRREPARPRGCSRASSPRGDTIRIDARGRRARPSSARSRPSLPSSPQ